MANIDNTSSINEVAQTDSKRRSTDRLQERLEAYLKQHGDAAALQLLRKFVHELEDRQARQENKLHGRKLRLLSDAMTTFIGYVNSEERHEFVNKVYEDWFQIPREQILGKTVRELIGDKSYTEIQPYIRSALTGKTVRFEVTYPPGAENERLFDVSYIPDFSDNGIVLGYFTLGQDVTDIRQREAMDKLHMLESARVARINTMGEMVAELAHELNQPLAAIKIYSDAVSRMLGKETTNIQDVQNALNEIRLQAGRAGDVISRLREFVSKRELQAETIQINSLIKEVLNLITVESRWHKVEVKLELDENIPEISVDRILIEQVVLNLARNAVEAMDAIDGDMRQMTIRTALGKYNEIEISVEDNGPGLLSDDLEKIFEPFYTSKAHGMGMGLAISRSIIKAHHGRLWAIPNDHGGTTFTIILLYDPETDVD